MKAVGLITSWRDNYGSVLQCYATKVFVQSMDLHCDVFYEENKGIEKYKHYLKRAFFLGVRSLRYKEFYHNYKIMRNNATHASSKIEKDSWDFINDFAFSQLQPKGVDYKLLKQLAYSEEYCAFIAGSDQIWNAHEPVNPVCFLSFAPDQKKVALAPSLGTTTIEKFNERDFRNYISDFAYVSVREEAGAAIINKLIGKPVKILPDPSILLTPAQWHHFAEKGCKWKRPYIFLHFLDKPSQVAVDFIRQLQRINGFDLVVLAYKHNEFENLNGFFFVNGTPQDYVSLIENAMYVCTDSFHTTLFSIYFGASFYTFERSYKSVASQSSRLQTLLKTYNFESRFIEHDTRIDMDELLKLDFRSCDAILKEERSKIVEYLVNALEVSTERKDNRPDLKGSLECTGCGVCVAACPRMAITFMPDTEKHFNIPIVDKSKCINCGLCEAKCHSIKQVRKDVNSEKAYIAYNKDPFFRKISASGGAFSSIAKYFIEKGGVVFGASIDFTDNKVKVRHAKAETIDELVPLLNSKYVQSDCSASFHLIKTYLNSGRMVLFSGTSCQVSGLYAYLGKKYSNLYTIDLICHGVPGEEMFQNYIIFLEQKYGGKITDFSFRKKNSGSSFYVITAEFNFGLTHKSIEIPLQQSSYYRMFMSADLYRDACYRCDYSTINKPADITLGDYYEAKDDYPELFDGTLQSLKLEDGISCVITHNRKGEDLLNKTLKTLMFFPIDVIRVQRSHPQLMRPSMYTFDRQTYFNMYNHGGYQRIERFIKRRDKRKLLIKKILKRQ